MRSWILLAYASLFVLGLGDNIRGPLFTDIVQEFQLSQSYGALFFSIASGMIIVAGFLGRYFVEKWGPIQALRLSLGLFFIGQIGIWLSPHYMIILGSVFIFGSAMGLMGLGQNVAVLQASPANELQRWLSGLHSMYGISSFLAPLLVSSMAVVFTGWRSPFLVTALVTFIFLVASFFVPLQLPRKVSDEDMENKGNVSEEIYFALTLGLYVGSELMMSTRLAQHLREVQGFELKEAAFYTSGFFGFLLLGRILFIFWKPKLTLTDQMRTCLVGAIGCIYLGQSLHPIFYSLVGFAMAPFYPLALTAAGGLFPRSLSSVTSFSIALSGLMIVLMHSVYGWIGDQWGLQYAIGIGPVLAGLSLVMIQFYPLFFKRSLG